LSRPGLRGYRVLVADGSLPACCVIELAAAPVVRKAVDGFLLAADPSSASTDEAAKSRYARVATLLGKEHIISSVEVAKALRDREEGKTGRATILNDDTKYSVVFEPSNGRVHVSFAGNAGVMGDAVTVSLPKPQPVKK
jgi:hypothetical protein